MSDDKRITIEDIGGTFSAEVAERLAAKIEDDLRGIIVSSAALPRRSAVQQIMGDDDCVDQITYEQLIYIQQARLMP